MPTYKIANKLFFEEVKDMLNNGKTVHIRVQGNSMLPFLKTDDLVQLVSPSSETLETGKIVLAKTPDKSIMLHRIYRINHEHIYLMGDGNIRQQEVVSVDDILGVATHLLKKEKQKVPLYTCRKRLEASLWRKLLCCRRGLLFISRVICPSVRKRIISKSE